MKTVEDLEKIALSIYQPPKNKKGEERNIPVGHQYPFGFRKFFKAFKKGFKYASQFQEVSDEIKSFDKSMSEMFRQHDWRAMYEFYEKMISPKLKTLSLSGQSDAVEFAEWVCKNDWKKEHHSTTYWTSDYFLDTDPKTTKELYQLFKDSKTNEFKEGK